MKKHRAKLPAGVSISARIPADLRDRLNRRLQATGVSQEFFLARAIEAHLDNTPPSLK